MASNDYADVKSGYTVSIETADGTIEKNCDAVLVVTGRRPESSLASELHLQMNGRAIATNSHQCTSIPHIYTIGDVTEKGMLAHSASHQAIHAVDHALGLPCDDRKEHIPACVYTSPELASVGMTEAEARASGNILIGKFPFRASGRALSVGPQATELIAEATLALELECTAEELMETMHAHPILSEGLSEAASQMTGKGIHVF